MKPYEEFLASKVKLAQSLGVPCQASECNPALKPHQRLIVEWMVTGGRRACFAAFGLGKSVIQLETIRMILAQTGGRGLIVIPLGVRQEFRRDAVEILGWPEPPKFIRSIEEAGPTGIYLTNYETVRDGKLDPSAFIAASLDEAAVLRGFGGTKTFREFMRLFTGDAGPAQAMRGVCDRAESVKYRFVATATPSPNEYIELLAYADFLGVMDVSQAKTRFFKRDSTKADKLTIHPHKEREFWLWVSSWALFVQRPEDLGCDGAEYVLPSMRVIWHEVPSNHANAGWERNGQAKLIRDSAIGVQDAASEKRSSLPARITKLYEIVESKRLLPGVGKPGELTDQLVIWSDLNDEQEACECCLDDLGVSFSSVYGHQSPEEKEESLGRWIKRETAAFLSKPVMHGAGVNLQQSHTMVFLGIGFKFYAFIQAIHRIVRFLQRHECEIHIVYSEAERSIRKELERKWQQHNKLIAEMTKIIEEFGLSRTALAETLVRKMGTERVEVTGEGWTLVNDDCVRECQRLSDASVGLILTSVPFCFDEETEILTPRGWLRFGELTAADDVATVHPEKLTFEWQRPSRIVWEKYEGEMLHFGNRVFDQLVTPNHRLWAAKRGHGFNPLKLKPVEASTIARDYVLGGRIARGWKTCVIPPSGLADGKNPIRVNIPPLPDEIRNGHGVQLYWMEPRDFMELAGWYLSEGHADSFEKGRSAGRLSIAQVTDDSKRREIADLFVRIGLPPSWHERQITVWCRNLSWFLIREFGSGSYNKRIPRWVLEFHPDLLTVLRDTMMKGDGARNGTSYTSFSQQLRDGFQELCIKTGWQACINGNHVHIATKQLYPEIRQAPDVINYSGMIGCVTTGNGLVIIRRNGKPCVSGNSTQYEYSPNYADFGHSEGNEEFFGQMDYLTPHLLRVLQPGRIAAIHVKDRIVPGGMTGLGFQTVYPFHVRCIEHYTRHGFAYMGMKTIVTDVVRENNQTYRLGWTEQCKDGSKMGVGMPEYLLLFRRPPTDTRNSYADLPVVKEKAKYTRSRWQIDAHGFARSSGNRLLTPEEIASLPHSDIFKIFRHHSLTQVYDFEQHVRIGEEIDAKGRLPVTFMLLQPQSWSDEVWTDITRMRTLNGSQSAKGKEMHLCPMQFDLADRVIEQMSMEGETVLDPFAGLGTVPMRAVLKRRKAIGIELSAPYFTDACAYCKSAEMQVGVPTLFDLDECEGEAVPCV